MINKRPNRCEGCDKSFGDGPGMAKRSKGAGPLSEKAVCANCERWQYRHPTLTMADRRRKLFGPADSGATVVALIEDVHWRQKATCKNANPAIFDVDEDAPNYTERHMLAATKYCANCPVLMECLADRAANPSYSLGVRGGIYFPLATNNSGKARKPDRKSVV